MSSLVVKIVCPAILFYVLLGAYGWFSNVDKISSVSSPILFMHSRDDSIIPFWHSELLYEVAISPKTHYWLDTGGHNGIPHTGDTYWERLESFVYSFDIP